MRRLTSVLLVVILLFLMTTPCFAVNNSSTAVKPRYAYIASNAVSFSINERPNVTTSDVYCGTYDNLEIQVTCKLQRYNNSKWNTIKTWTTSGMQDVSLRKTWAVPSGYTYRAYATFYIYDDNGLLLETASNSKSAYFPAS